MLGRLVGRVGWMLGVRVAAVVVGGVVLRRAWLRYGFCWLWQVIIGV